jgi:hypothetical protein
MRPSVPSAWRGAEQDDRSFGRVVRFCKLTGLSF